MQTNQSLLDEIKTKVVELIGQGKSNQEVADEVNRVWLDGPAGYRTSARSVGRARKRWGLDQPLERPEAPGVKLDGDSAQIVTNPREWRDKLNDTKAILEERGFDPEEWEVVSATVNEWDSPTGETLKQLKVHIKRRRSFDMIVPARTKGYRRIVPILGHTYGERLVVLVGDQQAPYHDTNLHRLFCEWLTHNMPDEGVMLGDTIDAPKPSRHPDEPDWAATTQECVDAGGQIARDYVQANERTRWKKLPGNHDERLRRAVIDRLGDFYGLRPAEIEGLPNHPPIHDPVHLLRLDELGVEYIRPKGSYDHASVKLSPYLAARHGWIARKGSGASAHATLDHLGHSIFVGHCFDDQTEILTPTGWQSHDDLEEGSTVLTLNRDSGELEWQESEAVYRYNDFNELVHIRNTNVDLAVTEGHGLWVQPYANGKADVWQEETAAEAYGKRRVVPLAGMHDETAIPLSDPWIKLIAWVMAEGHIDNKHGKRPYASVRISQSDAPDGRLERLCSIVSECGIPYSLIKRYDADTTEHGTHRNYDAYRIALHNPEIWRDKLAAYLGSDKTPTDLLTPMSASQIETFIAEYIAADGSVNKESQSYQIAAKRKDHIDWLQGLACRAGYRSSIVKGSSVYYLTLNPRVTSVVNADRWSRESYSGTVWCVTVPNGTLLVRRNGKTAITLNTHRQGHVFQTKFDVDGNASTITAVETGCMCRIEEGLGYAVAPDWQQGFATATIWPDGKFVCELATYVNGTLLYRDQRYS